MRTRSRRCRSAPANMWSCRSNASSTTIGPRRWSSTWRSTPRRFNSALRRPRDRGCAERAGGGIHAGRDDRMARRPMTDAPFGGCGCQRTHRVGLIPGVIGLWASCGRPDERCLVPDSGSVSDHARTYGSRKAGASWLAATGSSDIHVRKPRSPTARPPPAPRATPARVVTASGRMRWPPTTSDHGVCRATPEPLGAELRGPPDRLEVISRQVVGHEPASMRVASLTSAGGPSLRVNMTTGICRMTLAWWSLIWGPGRPAAATARPGRFRPVPPPPP